MKIKTPPPIRKPLPLTPLVDIVFLLLIFFMLSSTFLKLGHQELALATAGQASGTAKPVPGLLVRVGSAGRVSVNGVPVPADALTARLDAFAAEGVTTARISASPSANVQDFVTVLDAVRASRLASVSVE
jgi:biopolymer transport protein ExbD